MNQLSTAGRSRSAVDRVLITLMAAITFVYAAELWLEGPSRDDVLFLFWSVLAMPILLLAGWRTRSRGLRRLGFAIVPISLLNVTVVDALATGSDGASLVFAAFTAALPLYITYRTIRRIRADTSPAESSTPGGRMRAAGILAAATAVFALLFRRDWMIPSSGGEADYAYSRGHAGCYQLITGYWRPGWMPALGVGLRLPKYVALDTIFGRDYTYADTAGNHGERWRARNRLILRPAGRRQAAYWYPTSATDMSFVWSTGYTGAVVTLHRDGEEYMGTGHDFTDFKVGHATRSPVRAARVNCSLVP